VLDVHKLLFSILIGTKGMIHLNNDSSNIYFTSFTNALHVIAYTNISRLFLKINGILIA